MSTGDRALAICSSLAPWPVSSLSSDSLARRTPVSDGLEQHLAERGFRLDAERERRLAPPADRRSRRHGGSCWLQPLVHATGAAATSPGRLATTPASRSRPTARSSSGISARSRCCCETRAAWARPPSRRRPVYPFRDVVGGDITIFSPDLAVPHSDTWQAGVHAVDRPNNVDRSRYLGARSSGNWRTNNYNELNIVENGFLDEFKLGMANLLANNAAGGTRAGSFAYFGPGTGTAPLPIFLGLLQRRDRAIAGDPAPTPRQTSAARPTSTPLARFNPNPYASVDALNNDATAAQPGAGGRAARQLPARQSRSARRRVHRRERRPHDLQLDGARVQAPDGQRSGVSPEATCSATPRRRSFLSLRVDSPMVRNDGEEGDVSARRSSSTRSIRCRSDAASGSVAASTASSTGSSAAGRSPATRACRAADCSISATCGWSGWTRMSWRTCSSCGSTRRAACSCCRRRSSTRRVKAFSVSATSANGYGTLGPPSGRYIAPADSLDCIETIRGLGRLRAAVGRRHRTALQAVRSEHRQAGRNRRPRECRVPRRRAQRVQQRELLAGQRPARSPTAGRRERRRLATRRPH